MRDRRQHEPCAAYYDESGEDGVEAGEQLARRRVNLIHRPHAREDHRGVHERFRDPHALGQGIPDLPDHQPAERQRLQKSTRISPANARREITFSVLCSNGKLSVLAQKLCFQIVGNFFEYVIKGLRIKYWT